MNIDLYFFNLVNNFSGRWAWLDYLAMFCADYLGYFLLLILFLLLAINFRKHWKMVAEAIFTAILTRLVITSTIRWFWFRPRPFVVENFIPLIDQSPAEASFPSGHASFYFALSTIVYYYNKKLGIFFYAASLIIVLSRVFGGIHWPSDILIGAVIGILMGWLINKIFKKYAQN